jgi:hypothetical protein
MSRKFKYITARTHRSAHVQREVTKGSGIESWTYARQGQMPLSEKMPQDDEVVLVHHMWIERKRALSIAPALALADKHTREKKKEHMLGREA